MARTIEIAYATLRYPPMRTSGTYRVEAVTRYLPDMGFVPRVVTLPAGWWPERGASGLDHSQSVGDTDMVIQPKANHDPLVRFLSTIPIVRRLLREILIPDILAPWARSAAASAVSVLERTNLVYATSPPFSGLVLGHSLAERLGIPFVAEVRDPPSFNRAIGRRSWLTKRRMRRFEARYLGEASSVITVTPGTRSRLLEIHSHFDPERIFVVENGYPERSVDPGLSNRDPQRFTVTYVGSYQGDTRSSSGSLFTPRLLISHLDAVGGEVELRIVGPITEQQKAILGSSSERVRVTATGPVDRDVALAELAAADVALILAEDQAWWIGRKVYESLAYARRILAIVPPGDTTDLLDSSPKAFWAEPGDDRMIRNHIRSMYREWSTGHVRVYGPPEGLQSDRSCVEQIAGVLHKTLDG